MMVDLQISLTGECNLVIITFQIQCQLESRKSQKRYQERPDFSDPPYVPKKLRE